MNSNGYPQGHALLIGVANYQHISRLPNAILNDVNDVAATLSSPDYCGYHPTNVVTLLDANATRTAVLAGLDELVTRAGPDDTVCVFFSGHGGIVGDPGIEDTVLLTVDGDLADIENTSISSNELGMLRSTCRAAAASCNFPGTHSVIGRKVTEKSCTESFFDRFSVLNA
ncbi:caspase family protein, partial [Pseudomonas putida]|uniref:caspase family protein n=1 Tax=Pseudomonas putida TaxID=303 RepID=UPI0024E19391